MDKKRQIEMKRMRKVIEQLYLSFPLEKGTKVKDKFIAWYDTENHSPQGLWNVSTSCFWTFHKNKAYKVLVNKLLTKYGFGDKNVIVSNKSIHVFRHEILTNKNLLKVV